MRTTTAIANPPSSTFCASFDCIRKGERVDRLVWRLE